MYRQIMQLDCKPMPPKSLQNDAAIPQNPPKTIARILQNYSKMDQNDAWDQSWRDFEGMLARRKLADGFFDTPLAPPGRLRAPLGEPFGLPLASF